MRDSVEGRIQIAVALGDRIKRQELRLLLSKEEGLSVIAMAPALVGLLQAANGSEQIDVILLDADQPGMLNNHVWALFRSAMPLTRVVAFTSGRAAELVESLLALGVLAALSIEAPHRSIIQSIHNAARGILDYEPHLISLVKNELMYPHDDEVITIGNLVVDPCQREAERDGRRILLSPIEMGLLKLLADNQGKVVSFEALYRNVWGMADGALGSPDQLWSSIKRLRSKIETDPTQPEFIHSVRGAGYVLRYGDEKDNAHF